MGGDKLFMQTHGFMTTIYCLLVITNYCCKHKETRDYFLEPDSKRLCPLTDFAKQEYNALESTT